MGVGYVIEYRAWGFGFFADCWLLRAGGWFSFDSVFVAIEMVFLKQTSGVANNTERFAVSLVIFHKP
jgi:hypothetical protein